MVIYWFIDYFRNRLLSIYKRKYDEGYIVRNTQADITESKAFLKAIWTQIAAAFNNSYDEHLIFETLNEPRNPEDSHEHTWQHNVHIFSSVCDGVRRGAEHGQNTVHEDVAARNEKHAEKEGQQQAVA